MLYLLARDFEEYLGSLFSPIVDAILISLLVFYALIALLVFLLAVVVVRVVVRKIRKHGAHQAARLR